MEELKIFIVRFCAGAQERAAVGGAGKQILKWRKTNNYTKGFQRGTCESGQVPAEPLQSWPIRLRQTSLTPVIIGPASLNGSRNQRCLCSFNVEVSEVLPEERVLHGAEDHLDVLGVGGACEVGVERLVALPVLVPVQLQDELFGRFGVAAGPCAAGRGEHSATWC